MTNLEIIRDYLLPNGTPGVDWVVLEDDTVIKGPSMDEIDAARDAAKKAARRREKLAKRIEEAAVAKAAGYTIEGGPTLPFVHAGHEIVLFLADQLEQANEAKKAGEPLDKPTMLPDCSGVITFQQVLDHAAKYKKRSRKIYQDWSDAMIADAADDAKDDNPPEPAIEEPK